MSARLSASACEAADSPPDEDGPAVLIALASTKLRAVLAVDYVTFLVPAILRGLGTAPDRGQSERQHGVITIQRSSEN